MVPSPFALVAHVVLDGGLPLVAEGLCVVDGEGVALLVGAAEFTFAFRAVDLGFGGDLEDTPNLLLEL